MKSRVSLLIVLTLSFFTVFSQSWMYDNTGNKRTNFFEIQEAFNQYWAGKTPQKGQGYKQFKRWEYFWQSRVDSLGSFKPYLESKAKLKPQQNQTKAISGPWSFIGNSSTLGGYEGLGRINCMAFHPSDVNTFWVGTPNGGVWKTVNGGANWSPLNDYMGFLAVSDIAIDYTDPNIIYVATGDKDGSIAGIGVLKSTDGGATWSNLNAQFVGLSIRNIEISPSNNSVLVISSDNGVFRTDNGGTSWTLVQSGDFYDLEFHPTQNSVVYAISNDTFYKSTDNGLTWGTNHTFSYAYNCRIATSASSPNLVEFLTTNSSGGLDGIYRSTDGGVSSSKYWDGFNDGNILNEDLMISSGQGWYDLAFEISPTNSNVKFIGGLITYKTADNGQTWNLSNMWYDDGVNPIAHADKHFLIYHPLDNNILFECNDGGLYKTLDQGSSWNVISDDLEIGEIYRLSVSATSSQVLMGLQDNGSVLKETNGTFTHPGGGDGMDNAIDYTNADIQYCSSQMGDFSRTTDNWLSSVDISSNVPGAPSGAWISPFTIDPVQPQTVYLGLDQVYKSTDRGDSWTNISSGIFSTTLEIVEVAPSNVNYIYASDGVNVKASTNGGGSWSTIYSAATVSALEINPNDETQVFITTGNSVFESLNAGASWTDISASINLKCNDIISLNNGQDLYLATDFGVYTMDVNRTAWVSFVNNLPNVNVSELDIKSNKLYAATYGRGLWVRNIIQPTCNSTTVACGDVVTLNDLLQNGTANNACISPAIPTSAIYSQTLEFTTSSVSTVRLDYSANNSAIVLLQDACELPANCVSLLNTTTSTEAYSEANSLPAGTYYFTIYSTTSTPFDVELTCVTPTTDPCTNIGDVSCGGMILINNLVQNGVLNNACSSISIPASATYSQIVKFTISQNTNVSLDYTANTAATVIIQDACQMPANCISTTQTTAGIAEISNLVAGTYYVYLYSDNATPFALHMNCVEPACFDASPISCGQSISATTIGANNSSFSYSCLSTSFNAPDTAFVLDITTPTSITATLSNTNSPLKLFLVSPCDSSICLDVSATQIFYPNAPIGEYYLIVEGATSASQSNFTLSVNCNTNHLYHVTSELNPVGIGSISGDGYYPLNQTQMMLAQTTDTCSEFSHWTKNGVDIPLPNGGFAFYNYTVTEDAHFVAYFQKKTFTITLNSSINGFSTETGAGNYECGETVNISTVLNSGDYIFVDWTANGVHYSAQQSTSIVAGGNIVYTANYASTASVEENNSKLISIRPNPTTGEFTIEALQHNFTSLQIIDAKGALIFTEIDINKKIISVNISSHPKGIYQLILTDEKSNRLTSKVLKSE